MLFVQSFGNRRTEMLFDNSVQPPVGASMSERAFSEFLETVTHKRIAMLRRKAFGYHYLIRCTIRCRVWVFVQRINSYFALALKIGNDADNTRVSYLYDDPGNRTRKDAFAGITDYQWNEDNRLSVAKPVSNPVTMAWNAEGKRIVKQVAATTTKFLYDFEKVLQEADGSNVTQKEYTSTQDLYGDLLSAYDGSSSKYYEPDALGSTDALMDDAQSVTDRYKYKAFGLTTHTQGATSNDYQWVGRQGYRAESEIDLYLLGGGNGGRLYDPVLARFVTEDPTGFGSGEINMYRYGRTNPVNVIDPSGFGDAWEDFKNGVKKYAPIFIAPGVAVINEVRANPDAAKIVEQTVKYTAPIPFVVFKKLRESGLPEQICNILGNFACGKNGLVLGERLFIGEQLALKLLGGGDGQIGIKEIDSVSTYIKLIYNVLEDACALVGDLLNDPEGLAKWLLDATTNAIGTFIRGLPTNLPNWLLEWFFDRTDAPKPPAGRWGPKLLDKDFLKNLLNYLLERALPSLEDLKGLLPGIDNNFVARYVSRIFTGDNWWLNVTELISSETWQLPSPSDLLSEFLRRIAGDFAFSANSTIFQNSTLGANDAVNSFKDQALKEAARAHPVIATVVWLLQNAESVKGVYEEFKPAIEAVKTRDAKNYELITIRALEKGARLVIDALGSILGATKVREKILHYLTWIRRTILDLVRKYVSKLRGLFKAKGEIVGVVDFFPTDTKEHSFWVERRDGDFVVMVASEGRPACSDDEATRAALEKIKNSARDGSGPTQNHWNNLSDAQKQELVDNASDPCKNPHVIESQQVDTAITCVGSMHEWTGQGDAPKWESSKSRKAFGNFATDHGQGLKPEQLQNSANDPNNACRQTQFYDNDIVVEIEKLTPSCPGQYVIEVGKAIGRQFVCGGNSKMPIEGLTRAFVGRRADGTIFSIYPVRASFKINEGKCPPGPDLPSPT